MAEKLNRRKAERTQVVNSVDYKKEDKGTKRRPRLCVVLFLIAFLSVIYFFTSSPVQDQRPLRKIEPPSGYVLPEEREAVPPTPVTVEPVVPEAAVDNRTLLQREMNKIFDQLQKSQKALPEPELVGERKKRCVKDEKGLWRTKAPLRIFVYGPIDAQNKKLANVKLEACIRTMFGTEILIPDFFSNHHVARAKSPETADLVIFAVYPKCLLKSRALIPGQQVDVNAIYEATVSAFRAKYPAFFDRRKGRDLVFIFPSGAGARVFKTWDHHVPEAIFLGTEASNWKILHKLERGYRPYFDPNKDVVIPGYYRDADVVMSTTKPYEARDILVLYCGDYDKSEQRRAVGSLQKLYPKEERIYVRPTCPMGEYAVRSKFCLIPQGFTPWTVRLYEAIFAGCIPVVFSNRFSFPFPDMIDYSKFVVKFPEGDIQKGLIPHLDAITEAQGKMMFAALVGIRDKLQYNTTLPNNAFQQISAYLEHKFCVWTLQDSTTTAQVEAAPAASR